MAETSATILIPDISGFTEFMTSTELSHGSFAINMLIEAIIDAVGEAYDVSEIEGDAVLLIKKGPPPTQQQVEDICLRIFDAFHFRRKWIQQHAVCPCGACLAIARLTLKFVVHYGPVAEIKVGRFVKQSGTEMIIAHRLLKNNINNNEYLLFTEKLAGPGEPFEPTDMKWVSSSEEYPAIGKINFRFALLQEQRKKCPEPPALATYYSDDTPFSEMPISSGFRDVYMVMMNIPGRTVWMPELQKVEQDIPQVYVGSIHHCSFEGYEAIVSPLRMTLSADRILYAENCRIAGLEADVVHEYIFSKVDENASVFSWRVMNDPASSITGDTLSMLHQRMQRVAEELAAYCAESRGSAFNPAFQHL